MGECILSGRLYVFAVLMEDFTMVISAFLAAAFVVWRKFPRTSILWGDLAMLHRVESRRDASLVARVIFTALGVDSKS